MCRRLQGVRTTTFYLVAYLVALGSGHERCHPESIAAFQAAGAAPCVEQLLQRSQVAACSGLLGRPGWRLRLRLRERGERWLQRVALAANGGARCRVRAAAAAWAAGYGSC